MPQDIDDDDVFILSPRSSLSSEMVDGPYDENGLYFGTGNGRFRQERERVKSRSAATSIMKEDKNKTILKKSSTVRSILPLTR